MQELMFTGQCLALSLAQYVFLHAVFRACETVDDFDERISIATSLCCCTMGSVAVAVWFSSVSGAALLTGLLLSSTAFYRRWRIERLKPLKYQRVFS